MADVYVIWWRWNDNSGAGVLRAYADRQRAEEDLDLLEFAGDGRKYEIVDLPVYHDTARKAA